MWREAASQMGEPKEMLGTKSPSITSQWIQSAPAAVTLATSSPRQAKLLARIEGAMIEGRRDGMIFIV